ncbi:MAG: hypothetical protein H7A51_19560 [Akkermansiaceae bacterium]|nr:hypothetical protein [Akkermansiaceae bacterium]
MKKKYGEQLDREEIMATDNVVIIEAPLIPKYPQGYRPYVQSGLAALPVSSLLAFLLMRVTERFFPRKPSSITRFKPNTDY